VIPIQILRVLSTIQTFDVPALLMGGQACVLYGAAEYSRDLDLAVLATPDALPKLTAALVELHATVIDVPSFDVRYLERGHAVHFNAATRSTRNAVIAARSGGDVNAALAQEQANEMAIDAEYWLPLRRELETLRHAARKQ